MIAVLKQDYPSCFTTLYLSGSENDFLADGILGHFVSDLTAFFFFFFLEHNDKVSE